MSQIAIPMDPSDLNGIDWDLLEILYEHDRQTAKVLREEAEIPKSTLYYRLRGLLSGEFIEKIDHGFYQLGDNAPLDRLEARAKNGHGSN